MHYVIARTSTEGETFRRRCGLRHGEFILFVSEYTMHDVDGFRLEVGDKVTYVDGWWNGRYADEMGDWFRAFERPGIRLERASPV